MLPISTKARSHAPKKKQVLLKLKQVLLKYFSKYYPNSCGSCLTKAYMPFYTFLTCFLS